MAGKVRKQQSRATRRQTPRRVGDMTQEELRSLIAEIIDSRLKENKTPSSSGQDFDWIKAAREIRRRAPVGRNSTPLLRTLRKERAHR